MKVKILYTLLIIVNISLSTSVYSQNIIENPSAYANISATIITTVSANLSSTLEFGNFLPKNSGCKISVAPDGGRNIDGEISVKDNSYSSAIFYLSDDVSQLYSIALPKSSTTLVNESNSSTLTISDWNSEIDYSDGLTVSLGATLNVGSKLDNPPGVYKGSYAVTFINN